MARPLRIKEANLIFHVLNRANSKLRIFQQQIDYIDFNELLIKSIAKYKIKIYAYIIMPTHWHFVCSSKIEGEISRWMAWLQMMHTRKWHQKHQSIGQGHFYQGRFKSFIIQKDEHFLKVCRYVDRNALTADLVQKAEDWPYSSISKQNKITISKWPIKKPENYIDFVNQVISNKELNSIRKSKKKSLPFGDEYWVKLNLKKKEYLKIKRNIYENVCI